MPRPGTTRADEVLATLAERQAGRVSAAQLLARGVSRAAIRARLERGQLHPVRNGVYAVGYVRRDRDALWWGALLSVGERSRLRGPTAAAAYGARRDPWLPVHVVAACAARSKYPDIVVHRSVLDPADAQTHRGLPVTSLPLTLIDCAALLPPHELVQTIERIPRLDVVTMRRCLRRHAGRRGTRRIDDVLLAYEDPTRSHLERRFLALCRKHGLPKPVVNTTIEGRERDFAWADRRLVVETDGYAFHASRAQLADDHRRDLQLRLAGWTVQRLTYEAVVLTPDLTADAVRRLLASGLWTSSDHA